jgi:hypothetical protein
MSETKNPTQSALTNITHGLPMATGKAKIMTSPENTSLLASTGKFL